MQRMFTEFSQVAYSRLAIYRLGSCQLVQLFIWMPLLLRVIFFF